ncbi:MAG: beta-lactamase [Ferruginibacter sp.]|nr:beta-lactamase [Ferruginibacter sp.]
MMIPTFSSLCSSIASPSFKRRILVSALLFCGLQLISCKSQTTVAEKTATENKMISLPAGKPFDPSEKNRLYLASERWFDSLLKNSGFNGGMLVAKNGQVVFEKYRGTTKLHGTDSITAETPFHIASVSKTFTAMAVLKLYQDGKVGLDDEFSKYFPSFNYPGVTVRTLLSHRSGLPNYLYFMEDLGWNKEVMIKNQDVLDYLVNRKADLTNIAPPNRHFTYCNTNFALAALLIEKVSGMSYPEFISQTFFQPLGMTHSFVYTPADSAKVPPSYDWRGGEIPLNFLDQVYGDKNIFSTPRDLLIWDRALSSNAIFKPETLAQAYAGYSNEKPGIKNYGLGWRMNNYPNGKKMIFHNGWWHGNNAVFIRLFDEDATIILVNNRFTSAVYKARHLVNSFGNYFQEDVEEEAESSSPATPGLQTTQVLPLKAKPVTPFQRSLQDKNRPPRKKK